MALVSAARVMPPNVDACRCYSGLRYDFDAAIPFGAKRFMNSGPLLKRRSLPAKQVQISNDPPKRAVEVSFYSVCRAIRLALSAYIVSPIGLAGWIKRFPPGLLPSRTAVLKINSGPVEYGVEPGPVGVRHPC